ncbi:MAG: dihydroorotase [Clostridia bacterium]|nr:dihydroorotase [Clostridia bacterium]
MKNLLIKNVRIIDPKNNEDFIGDILFENGKVALKAEKIEASAERVIDGKGLVCAPGLVDMHVHLRDPGLTYKEDIITGCNAAAAGGVTSLLCMPNTSPAIDTPETVEYIIKKAKNENAKARVYVAAAATMGLKGSESTDLAALKKAGAIACSDDGRPIEDTRCLVKALKECAELGMTLTAHCEDLYLASKWLMNEGEVSKELNIPGVPNAAEDCGTAREIAAAAAYNLPIHICHVSTKGSCQLIRDAKKRGVKVTAESAPHYMLLTDKELYKKDADYRMNPPLRAEEDRTALIEAVLDGTIDCIATDHAPHSVEEKAVFEKSPNGSIGMETSLSGMITVFDNIGNKDLSALINMMSVKPAEILGIDAGTLSVGANADAVIFDPEEKWIVDTGKLHGKSKNAVLKNMELKGKVKYTILGGEIVFED